MQNAALMRKVHRPAHSDQNLDCLFRAGAAGSDHVRQTAAINQLHAEIVLAFVRADLVNGQDVGVIEVGGRLGLGVEALNIGFAGQLTGEDHLHRDQAIETDLAGFPDHAHSPAGDFFDEFIVAEVTQDFRITRSTGNRGDRLVGIERFGGMAKCRAIKKELFEFAA